MFWHDLRIAVRSIRQNPFIAALIVAVIAVGISTSVVAITLYHTRAGNPIWWKNDVLYRVMLDSRPAPIRVSPRHQAPRTASKTVEHSADALHHPDRHGPHGPQRR